MRMVHILTSVVGSKCEVQVKNGGIYEGVFKTYSPKCDLVLDAAHEKSTESSSGPKREEIMESILFKCSDFVVVQFKDMDSSYARRDAFTDSAISAKVNGEHKEKDLEPWDAGELTTNDELEALENDVSNGWDPNDMFRYNEENYGVVSTYDSSLSSYTSLGPKGSKRFIRIPRKQAKRSWGSRQPFFLTVKNAEPERTDCLPSFGARILSGLIRLGFGGPPLPFVVLLLPLAGPFAPPAAPSRASPLGARASPPRSGVSSARPAPGCPRPACGPVYGPLTMSLKPQQQQQQQQPQPQPAAANARKPGGGGGGLLTPLRRGWWLSRIAVRGRGEGPFE
nr:PREDICTED: ataxin-2-like [Bos indicus]